MFFFLMIRRPPRSTLFPTRRSSDLAVLLVPAEGDHIAVCSSDKLMLVFPASEVTELGRGKGVRLQRCRQSRSEEHTSNSSHLVISYAVFCLEKKSLAVTQGTARERT